MVQNTVSSEMILEFPHDAIRQSIVIGFTFADVLDAFDSKVVVIDVTGRIVYANRIWYGEFPDRETALRWSVGADYLSVCDAAAIQGDKTSKAMAKALREVLTGEREGFEVDYPCHSIHISRWFTLRVSIFISGGKRFAVLLHKDITRQIKAEKALEQREQELRKMNGHLSDLAKTDVLTGVCNRRGFTEAMKRELSRASRFKTSLSLLMLDVDHFKNYNDTYGHPAGDVVLAQLGELLKSLVRDVDTAARYGGEEFVLLLPETDSEGATALGERVRATVEATIWKHFPVTVSVGVTTTIEGRGDADQLLRMTDEALYRSKREGRNRVTVAENRLEDAHCVTGG